MESTDVVGDKNEIVTAPFFNLLICAAVKGCTERTTSASLRRSPEITVAPAERYWSSDA